MSTERCGTCGYDGPRFTAHDCYWSFRLGVSRYRELMTPRRGDGDRKTSKAVEPGNAKACNDFGQAGDRSTDQ